MKKTTLYIFGSKIFFNLFKELSDDYILENIDDTSIKKNFVTHNNLHLQKILKINKFYSKQNRRTNCKNCNLKLSKKTFTSFMVNYVICQRCGHLNGQYEESQKFLRKLYSDNDGKNYSKNY